MKIKDSIKKQSFGGTFFPKLHGHTKITLTDVKTGEQEIVEKDNLVTTFVSDVFANNIFGGANYADLTPMHDLFGGVLCFNDSLEETAKLIPNEIDNKLIANAGQSSHSSASTTRGNPNGYYTGETLDGKGYIFVWDFPAGIGTGEIASLALCHKWGGDYGTKPIEAISDEFPIVCSSNKSKILNGTDYDDCYDHYYDALLSVDLENETGLHAYLNNDSLIVTEVSLNLKTQGLNNPLGNAEAGTVHTVSLTRTYDRRYASVCSDGTYIYVTQPSGENGNTLYVDKVSMSNWTSADASITESSMSLAYINKFQYAKAQVINRRNVSDGYIYALASTKRTFYKISLTNSADITLLDSILEEDVNEVMWGMNEITEGILVGANYMINGNKVYPCTPCPVTKIAYTFYDGSYADRDNKMGRLIRDGNRFYLWSYANEDGYEVRFYNCIGFPALYLGTIQNLPSVVSKTSDKAMQIEYTLTIANS